MTRPRPTQSLLRGIFGHHLDRATLTHHFLYETPSMLGSNGLYASLNLEEVLALSHSFRFRANQDPGFKSLLAERDLHKLFSYVFEKTPEGSLTFRNIRGAANALPQSDLNLWRRLNPYQETRASFDERLARCDPATVQKVFEELSRPTRKYVDPIEHDRRVYEYGEDKSQFVVLPLLGFSRSNQIRGYIKDIVEMLLKE